MIAFVMIAYAGCGAKSLFLNFQLGLTRTVFERSQAASDHLRQFALARAVKDENGKHLVVQQYHMDIWGEAANNITDDFL